MASMKAPHNENSYQSYFSLGQVKSSVSNSPYFWGNQKYLFFHPPCYQSFASRHTCKRIGVPSHPLTTVPAMGLLVGQWHQQLGLERAGKAAISLISESILPAPCPLSSCFSCRKPDRAKIQIMPNFHWLSLENKWAQLHLENKWFQLPLENGVIQHGETFVILFLSMY